MLKTGDIVLRRNLTFKKKDILFIVLFNLWDNEKEYVCVCPITNTQKPKNNPKYFLKNYVYIPYEILNDKKMCSIKINVAPIYETSELSSTGLSLKPEIMLRIFNSIMDLDLNRPSLDKEHYEYIKNTITFISEDLKTFEEKRKKEEKKLKEVRKKQLKKNYDIKNNYMSDKTSRKI